MHSTFPDLLAYWAFAPLILRIVLVIVFAHWAKSSNENIYYRIMFGILSLSFLIGIFTQIASLVSLIYFGFRMIEKMMKKQFMTDGVNYYFILFAISASLLLLGAGRLAIDFGL